MNAHEILAARGYTEIVEKAYVEKGWLEGAEVVTNEEAWVIGFAPTLEVTRHEKMTGGLAICVSGRRTGVVHPARAKARDGRVSECVADEYYLFDIEELEADPRAL